MWTVVSKKTMAFLHQKARTELVEMLAEVDEQLEECYLTDDTQSISPATIHAALRRTTLARTFVPILVGSAKGNKGVQDVLDAVCQYLPSPGAV